MFPVNQQSIHGIQQPNTAHKLHNREGYTDSFRTSDSRTHDVNEDDDSGDEEMEEESSDSDTDSDDEDEKPSKKISPQRKLSKRRLSYAKGQAYEPVSSDYSFASFVGTAGVPS